MPPRPRNDQTSQMPCMPSLGSQKFRAVSHGLRGKEPGGYALPRSSRQTDLPAPANRYVLTEPPKPDPTTTTSKCSCGSGCSPLVTGQRAFWDSRVTLSSVGPVCLCVHGPNPGLDQTGAAF